MNLTYEEEVEIPIDVWERHKEKDDLVNLVERAGYIVIGEAFNSGMTGKLINISMNIVPNFDEDKTHQVVRVVLEYEPVV